MGKNIQYNKFIKINTIYLRGRVKFPTGGDENIFSKPASLFFGRIWCDSKADSKVWMGEDGGLATFEKNDFLNVIKLAF